MHQNASSFFFTRWYYNFARMFFTSPPCFSDCSHSPYWGQWSHSVTYRVLRSIWARRALEGCSKMNTFFTSSPYFSDGSPSAHGGQWSHSVTCRAIRTNWAPKYSHPVTFLSVLEENAQQLLFYTASDPILVLGLGRAAPRWVA